MSMPDDEPKVMGLSRTARRMMLAERTTYHLSEQCTAGAHTACQLCDCVCHERRW